MIEKIYDYKIHDEKEIEKIIDDEYAQINHMTLTKDTGLPIHQSNSNIYMILIRGKMTIELEDQEAQEYTKGKIINIPNDTKMNVRNLQDEVLEFFVVKAPHPRELKKD